MVRLALIGRLQITERYAAVATRVPDAKIVAVVDTDAERAKQQSVALGTVTTEPSIEQLLDRHSQAIDAVLVHSSSESRAGHAQQAARASKHVLVDSPLALSTEDADAVIEACQMAGVQLMVGASMRFVPAQQAVRCALDAGKLGTPGLLRLHHWQSKQQPPDGASELVGRISNEMDLAIWFFDALPTHVHAVGRPQTEGAQGDNDYVQVHIGFPKGGMAVFDVCTDLPVGKDYFSLSLIGSDGAAYADDHHNMHLLFRGGAPAAVVADPGTQSTLAQLTEFVAAIEQQRPPAVTGADGRAAVRVAQAVRESLRTGKAIHLDPTTGGD